MSTLTVLPSYPMPGLDSGSGEPLGSCNLLWRVPVSTLAYTHQLLCGPGGGGGVGEPATLAVAPPARRKANAIMDVFMSPTRRSRREDLWLHAGKLRNGRIYLCLLCIQKKERFTQVNCYHNL